MRIHIHIHTQSVYAHARMHTCIPLDSVCAARNLRFSAPILGARCAMRFCHVRTTSSREKTAGIKCKLASNSCKSVNVTLMLMCI